MEVEGAQLLLDDFPPGLSENDRTQYEADWLRSQALGMAVGLVGWLRDSPKTPSPSPEAVRPVPKQRARPLYYLTQSGQAFHKASCACMKGKPQEPLTMCGHCSTSDARFPELHLFAARGNKIHKDQSCQQADYDCPSRLVRACMQCCEVSRTGAI